MGNEEGFTEFKKSPEDIWIDHCEEFLRRGWTPRRWKDLPDYLKTERMREYYVELKKRIEARDQEK
ncbi:hypothetical protein LEP1GSC127_2928 [Leptospira kirschneri str. 200801925]|uniref:Uncharacterized protein n=1 Tax=Leptospira kirschneri str. 200802841 TaxID=1193047 RepID=A0A828Y7R3_9LEPT|nr:hypothetical protein [Leptospira kirschneri]EKO51471.1 hypothetical protein LEP1GSC131_2061 [Leptospira kirschneri str. 200802841]EMO73933.1 hypothetical protein LEP1GSC127_2928 [Leptospira kirschneri str. 200801925]